MKILFLISIFFMCCGCMVKVAEGYNVSNPPEDEGKCVLWHDQSNGYNYILYSDCKSHNNCKKRKFVERNRGSHKHKRKRRNRTEAGICRIWHDKSNKRRYAVYSSCKSGNNCDQRFFDEE